MNRSLIRITTYLQIGIMVLMSVGCTPTQPFFYNETPDLQYYLNTATSIEYPDVEVESLAETTQAVRPLTIGNHDYQFWDLSLEECVSIALQNAKFFITTSGNAEFRQNIAAQFTSGSADQFGSIYDVAVGQATTQSIPLTIDSSGNRVLPRGVLRANQVGGVEDALAEFDAQASGFVNFATTDRAQNVGAQNTINPQVSQATNVTQQSAISKRMATGGVATLRQQILYSRNNTPINGFGRAVPSDYTALLEAQVQHPLMRNRGTMVNRIPVVLASLNEDISIADFEIQVRNLVRDVEVKYWDLYISYRAVATSIIGRNSAIATAQFARLNLENGTGTRQELAQAVEQYYQFRGLLESALAGSNLPGSDQFGVYGRERALREVLGLAATDGRLVRPVDEPSLARVEHDWDETVAQLLYLSPEIRRNKVRIKQSELELVSAKNQVLPEVNLSLLYRWVGVGDTLGPPNRRGVNFPDPGSSALGELTEGNYQEGAIRLEITPPAIGMRRELTRIRGAQLRLAREKAFLQEQERLLVSQLSDAVAKVATHYQLVQTNAQRWQAAEQEVEARLAEFKGGRSSVNVVLQSQQRRAQAQIDYYRALGEYNKSVNYVDYLKGTMLANSNITLAEGPWNDKAYCDALERARERSAGKQLQYGVSRPAVVRTGPLRDADAAMEIIGSGVTSVGQAMPPQVNGLGSDPLELNLEPHRGPVDVNDVPLSEMGNSSQQLLSPHVTIESMGPPSREMNPPNRMFPDNAQPEVLNESTLAPPALPTPDPNTAIDQISHESTISVDYAPQPVKRKPLPTP
tara:strand:- start:254050 stop:256464 length:2415 start_codon:yes stop_codon:yes gene_type:complete